LPQTTDPIRRIEDNKWLSRSFQDNKVATGVHAFAFMNLALNDANQVTLMVVGVHVRILRAMDRHRDDANVQDKACSALCNLDANKLTLVAAEAHVRIIRAMDRHQDDANVQERACKALRNLAAYALGSRSQSATFLSSGSPLDVSTLPPLPGLAPFSCPQV
jgi:hypothetical protein